MYSHVYDEFHTAQFSSSFLLFQARLGVCVCEAEEIKFLFSVHSVRVAVSNAWSRVRAPPNASQVNINAYVLQCALRPNAYAGGVSNV